MTNMPKSPAAKPAEEKAVKTAATKAEAVKTPAETVKAPVEAVKTAEVKTPAAKAVKAAAKKPAVKKAAEKVEKLVEKVEKKTTAKKAAKAEPKSAIVVEYQGRQVMEADLLARAKQVWANAGKTEAIQEINLYVKPEDGAVYCVINGEAVGKFRF